MAKTRLHIIHVVPSLEQEASGPSYSVPQLANALADRGHHVHLLSVGGQAPGVEVRCEQTRFASDWTSPPLLKNLWRSRDLRIALTRLAQDADVIHSHGLWAMPNVYSGGASVRTGAALVVSPRGTMGAAALEFSKIRKRVFWATLQGRAVEVAAALHATSDAEYAEIRAFGLSQPVIVAPNGITLPLRHLSRVRERSVLYLGRIHPKKGLEALLGAWARTSPRHSDWRLRIVGPGQANYIKELQRLSASLDASRVTFEGPLYGESKQAAYDAASLFVMPTLNENFGMTVAEALASSLPVICTKGAPWSGLEVTGAGWWVEGGVQPIAAALDEAMSLSPTALARMGAAGRDWMTREFTWPAIAESMETAYEWVLQGGRRPPSVHVS